jgi:hypothetical protein
MRNIIIQMVRLKNISNFNILTNGDYLLTFFFNLVTSPVEFISNISLKRKMAKQDRDNLLLTLPNLKTELFLSYEDMNFGAALTNDSMGWYELASYIIEETNGTFSKVHLHLNDFVTIHDQDHDESYAIVKGIIRHKGNDDKYYAFVVVEWLENVEQEHQLLKCPLYRLQSRNQWRRIFPISVIDNVQKVHFIHNCNSERCEGSHHDVTNRSWLKNNFYFTAI